MSAATSMRVDYDVALEIASHEAIIRQAYKDSVGRREPIGKAAALSIGHPLRTRI